MGKSGSTDSRPPFLSVRPGGVYVIEDLETSYYPTFGGGPIGKEGTTIAVLKQVCSAPAFDCCEATTVGCSYVSRFYGRSLSTKGFLVLVLLSLVSQFVDVLNRDFVYGQDEFNKAWNPGHGTYSITEDDNQVASLQCFRYKS